MTGNLITVPNDAVENFTLLANQFDTEFGHSSGGQFNTTIKSGTNGIPRIALRILQESQPERGGQRFCACRD